MLIWAISWAVGCKTSRSPSNARINEIAMTSVSGSESYLFYMDRDRTTFSNINKNDPDGCLDQTGISGRLSCGRVIKMSQCSPGGVKSREFCTINTLTLPLVYFRHALTNGEYNYMEALTYYIEHLDAQISELESSPSEVSQEIIQAQIGQKRRQITEFKQKRDALQAKWQDVTNALNLLQQTDLVFEMDPVDESTQAIQKVVKKMSDIFMGRRNRMVSVGKQSCLLDDNKIRCWGEGALLYPIEVLSDSSIRDIAISANYHCLLRSQEHLTSTICYVKSGEPITNIAPNPIKVVAGNSFACVLNTSSTPVTCIGDSNIEERIPAMMDVVDIVAGQNHVCALHAQGVSCWSTEADAEKDQVYQAPVFNHPYMIFAGLNNSCANDLSGFRCWGSDPVLTTPSAGITRPSALAQSENHACAIQDGTVSCWGSNYYYQLNVRDNLVQPVLVSTGFAHTCVGHKSGITCWGRDEEGQENANDFTDVSLNASY